MESYRYSRVMPQLLGKGMSKSQMYNPSQISYKGTSRGVPP